MTRLANYARRLAMISVLCLSACVPKTQSPGTVYKVTTTPPATAGAAATPAPSLDKPLGATPIPDNVPEVKIGLLLPLSGDQEQLGKAMLDAATLAVYDQYFSLPASKVKAKVVLVPKDTGNSTTTAVNAANAVIGQGVSLIIGPVFSSYVQAVAPVAKKAGVPVLTLSNNKSVASDGIYAYGFMPDQQATRIAEFASLKKLTTFGALSPSDAYGKAVSEALVSALGARGLRVSPLEIYAARASNMEAAVARVKAGYDRTPFQALFVAEGGEALKQILSLLSAQKIDRKTVRFLGTGTWDEEEIFKMPEMEGAWFASANANYYRPFASRFLAVYGYRPQRIASLAYDGAALAVHLALEKGGANYTQGALTREEGFIGPANGLYRLLKDGTNERGLAVIEIQNGQPKVLDAAPLGFKKSSQ